jgi:hypothetical protein
MSLLKAERIPGKHTLIKALLVFLSVVFFLNPTLFASQNIERKKVLVLFGFRPTITCGFAVGPGYSVLEADTPYKMLINIEHLDLTHFNDERYIEILLDLYRKKYSKHKPDLIIPVLNEAVVTLLILPNKKSIKNAACRRILVRTYPPLTVFNMLLSGPGYVFS